MCNSLIGGILGLIVGDALGVPFEFIERDKIKKKPIQAMIGYGVHNQPIGTWSDDSSLTLCLVEQLAINELNIEKIGESFVEWLYKNKWTPHGEVFDVGISTQIALDRIKKGEKAEFAGNFEEFSNGNGSLMRILPLFLETRNIESRQEKYDLVKKVSSITHAHIRACLSCFYYLEIANFLSYENNKQIKDAYEVANDSLKKIMTELNVDTKETKLFNRLTSGKIAELKEEEIFSSGYVIHTLEASVWCLLNTKSYKEALLKAVNLGNDTDTVGAVTGGLAGMYYGLESIPEEWLRSIARLNEIKELLYRLSKKYFNGGNVSIGGVP